MTAASSHVNHRRPEAGRLHRPFRAAALVALAGALAFAAQVALAQVPTRLTKVELQPQPGNQLEVKLVLDGPAPQPVAFTIDNPARLAVDLPGTAVALESRRIDVKSGGVDSIVAAEASGRTRVVFNLDSLQPYSTRTEGNNVFVSLGRSAGNEAAAATVSTATPASAAPGAFAIEKVDFRRGTDGAGRIIVRTSDPRVQASVRQEGGRTVVDFPRTSVAPEAARRYDVVDFATPVNSFDVTSTPNGARIVVNATGEYEQLGYQSDREYVLELRQRTKAAALADPGKKEYRGERLTLNFQDIETRAVLQLLAETSGQNIVVSDTVQGNVTLRLQNVPWDQALDIVMRTKGLDKRQEGNVIYVAPAEELAAREKQLLESQKSLTELAPVRTEYLQVNYAKASDLASLIQSQGKGSLLSERGSLAIDERTNTLLLQDTADRLADIRRMVQTLDIPVKQVLIEARIVIVNDDFSRELGVRFGGAFVGNYGSNDGLMYVSNSGLNSADGSRGPIISPNGPGGVGVDGNAVATGLDRYLVNLPIANPAGRIAMTLLDSDYVVDLEITAAQREGRGEVVSAPRVITANGKEAVIEQGTEIPYQESASSGATTTQFKKAVLSLKVTPQITPDDRVILDLTVSKDSVGQILPSATGGSVPSIDTREITTQVLVNDGQTVVLGGILETERRDTVNKVPFLGDVPGLGWLFRSKGKTDNKDELLIFVTPKILREGAEIY
ncbi:MAG: type IV pilus secretin PilQ [Steroidobacteraceae bacterium]|jgi:type IV pilus assembly protein PilQ|nr:type IV pilus secretin PilQ [Pseudomonadota bacterium]MBP7607903.1 type IV pilus secretin PilQ [Steroidobacteraceae bacterium]MBP9128992.1 type IV pilus secretin PilQ [Steroidobacteraceae bacterium]